MLSFKQCVATGLAWFTAGQVLSQTEAEPVTKSVVVYLKGVNETRTASVQVSGGEQQLVFTNLPARLNPSTLRVSASSFIQIVSINHKLNYLATTDEENPEIRPVKDSMEMYREQVTLKQGVYNSLQSTRQMILANKTVKGETQGMEPEDIVDLLDFYRDKLNEIHTKSLALERQLEITRQKQDKFTREYNKLVSGKNKVFSEVRVTVRATQAGKASFSLEYYTPDAGWTPTYDIRNKGTSEQLDVTSFATIWQKTGYDWKNVTIKLSTIDPQFNINAPEVSPKMLELNPYTGYAQQQGQYNQYKQQFQQEIQLSQGWMADSTQAFSSDRLMGNNLNGLLSTIPGAELYTWDYGNAASEKGPGTEYAIAAPYSIASNGEDKRIEINRKTIAAKFKYKTVPKIEKGVFLMALLTGWDTLNYYPGTANIFNNGTYVGNVWLNTQNADDSLELSLGQDKAFSVEYEVLNDKTFTTNSGSSVKRGKGFTIKVMNKKDVPVTIEITDQVPLVSNSEVSLTVDKNDGQLNTVTGITTWRKAVAPGQKIEIPISYTVKYPKDHYLYNF